MTNRLITAPTAPPLTVEEVKIHLEETNSDRDDYILFLIWAAAGLCQKRTLRSLMPQTRETTLDAFPANGFIELEYPPVRSIESVIYLDNNGIEQTVSPSSYRLDNASDETNAFLAIGTGRQWPQTYNEINAVRVRYLAGYEDAESIPAELRLWMKLIIGHMYANREAVGATLASVFPYVDQFINSYRAY